MKQAESKNTISNLVNRFANGLYTLPELFDTVNCFIMQETENITDIDSKIRQQQILYKFACQSITKAIGKIQRT